MSVPMGDLDPEAIMAAHKGLHFECFGPRSIPQQDCEPYRLAEQMQRWRWEHALVNDGCVPGAAYRDLAKEVAAEPQRTRVAVVKALRNWYSDETSTLTAAEHADAIENGADW